jgi:hypothetical protein
VHHGLSEKDAEDLLVAKDEPGSWLLREVLPDEAWGDSVEAEVAVDRSYRVSQCKATGRLVVDGRVLNRTMDASVGALCAYLGLGLGDVVLADGTGLSELEWNPVHEGLSLEVCSLCIVLQCVMALARTCAPTHTHLNIAHACTSLLHW